MARSSPPRIPPPPGGCPPAAPPARPSTRPPASTPAAAPSSAASASPLANAGDAEVRVETRSGATADPESAPWSDWIEAGSLGGGDRAATLEIPSQPARFLQYRLTLDARDGGGSEKLPAVEEVTLSYAVPNLAPSLKRLTLEAAEPGEAGEPTEPTVEVSWEASDPDGDALVYEVSWQQPGTDRWLTAAEELTDTSFTWNTRGLADGRYLVRVTASDLRANPPGSERTATRRSDAFLVDQTGPDAHRRSRGPRRKDADFRHGPRHRRHRRRRHLPRRRRGGLPPRRRRRPALRLRPKKASSSPSPTSTAARATS